MRHPIRTLAILLIVALLTSLLHLATLAQSSGEPTPFSSSIVQFGLPPGEDRAGTTFALMLELYPDANPAAVQAELQKLGVQQLYQTTLNYKGIAVSGSLSQLQQFRALAGVRTVRIIPAKQRLRTHAASSAAALQIPSKALFNTGKHVRIGIIDSGIDYTHATFGGPGTAAAFDANNPAIIEPNSFPTPKVAGGFDLAGDTYDADGVFGSPVPAPDPDPLDCAIPAATATLNRGGHGTHVAALAAGFGVQNGETFLGSYKSLLPTDTFDLAPGVAPEATLYAFKVFGCRGSTVLLGKAIAQAIDPNGDGNTSDRMVDILNIAIGSTFASADDPDAQAVNAAVAAGVTVVLAAGDSGDVFYGGSAPGNASGAITVGAVGATELADFSSRSPQPGGEAPKPDIVAPGVAILSAAAGSGAGTTAMDGTSMAAAQATGAAAILLERRPFWNTAQIKGALISTATALVDHRGLRYPSSLAGAGLLNIDAISAVSTIAFAPGSPSTGGISFDATSLSEPITVVRQVSIYNGEGVVHVVQLSATDIVSETGVIVTVPSDPIELFPCSATTVAITLTVKPSALGETPDAFTPLRQGLFDRYYLSEHSGSIAVSSAPFARLRVAHLANLPDVTVYIDQRVLESALSAEQVSEYQMSAAGRHMISIMPRNAILGTATPLLQQELDFQQDIDSTIAIVGDGASLQLALVKADRIDPAESVIQLLNANAGGPVDIAIDGTRVANTVGYLETIPMQPIRSGSHRVSFYEAGTNTLIAKQDINPLQRQNMLVGITSNKGFAKEAWNDRAPKVHISLPYQLFPKSASIAHATVPTITTTAGQSILSIRLNNSGARNQALSPRGSQTPLVGAFELSATSPAIADLSASGGVADIQHVGITSNYSITNNIDSNVLFFATTSYVPWATPNEVQVRVYMDTTGSTGVPDGTDDYVLISSNFGSVTSLQPSDTFVSLLYKILPDGTLAPTNVLPSRYNTLPSPSVSPSLDVAPFNSRVLIQYIGASFVGLSNSQPVVRYHVETRARSIGNFGALVDRVPATGSLEYRINAAAIAPVNAARGIPNLQHRPLFPDIQGGQVQASINPAILAARRQQNVLLLHLHNAPESQVDLVTVVSGP